MPQADATIPPPLTAQEQRHREELEAVLDKLDAQAEFNPDRRQRKAARSSFRRQHVRAALSHPGGTTTACDVLTRDLSSGGLAFVHNGYIHVKTRVELMLVRRDGDSGNERTGVCGTVVRCDHIARTWHNVGVKFDAQIDPDDFTGTDADDRASTGRAPLVGRVLHVDGDEMERRLLAHHLRQTGLEVVGVSETTQAAGEIARGGFDLVITECRFSPRNPAEAGEAPARRAARSPAELIRAAGHAGPIAVCTGEASAELMRTVAGWHVRGVLCKPYPAARLLERVGEWLAPPAGSGEPLASSLAAQVALRPRLEAYVANLKKLQMALSTATAAGQEGQVRAMCLALRGTAAAHGYAEIAEAAAEATAKLSAPGGNLAQARPALERLDALCGRACVGPTAPPAVAA